MRYAGEGQWAEFLVPSGGRHTWVDKSDGPTWDDVTELFLGPIFSHLLGEQGHTCLHAAVLEVDGRAFAVGGPAGVGKSTMAVALVRRGAHLVSDDVAVLTELPEGPAVWPGPARLRLSEETASWAGFSPTSLPLVWASPLAPGPKRYLDLSSSPGPAGALPPAVPLAAIYILGQNEPRAEQLRPLGPAEALALLMRNRHHPESLLPQGHARDFRRLAALAARVKVCEPKRAESLEKVDAVAAALLDDMARLR